MEDAGGELVPIETPRQEAEVICGAEFASCVCVLPYEHESEIHECQPWCGGSWRVEEIANSIGVMAPVNMPVTFPMRADPFTMFGYFGGL